MIDDVSILNSAQSRALDDRRYLDELQRTTELAFATGRQINRVTDDPVDYYSAQYANDQLNDIADTKALIEQDIAAYNTALAGLDAIERLGQQLEALAYGAASDTYLTDQFDTIREQITSIANDTVYNGQNLISEEGLNSEIGLSSDYDDFSDPEALADAIDDIGQFVSKTRSVQYNLANDISLLQIQEQFNTDLANTFQRGVDRLVNADLNEQAASAISLQLRDAVSVEGLRTISQSQALLTNLLAGT